MMASPHTIGQRIIRFDEIDSTNSFLMREKQYLKEHGLVVIAQFQAGGRGRGARKFRAFPGKNITFSVVIHPSVKVKEISIYSLLAGIAVVRTLKAYTTTPPRLKWPNDVLINRRKICGILLEVSYLPELHHSVLVMGIGINCLGNSGDYPEELQSRITTLQQESKLPIDQESVFQAVLRDLEGVLAELETRGSAHLLHEWIAHSKAIGSAIKYETQKGWVRGTIEGLTPTGYLLIRDDFGELQTHISGDVRYLESPYGS